MPPKVGVVGCGAWGVNLVRNFFESGALACVCDARPEAAAAMQHAFGAPAVSLDRILEDQEVDAIAIASPAALHFEIARQSLSSGKDVFVEKPLAVRISHAEELCELAERRERVLMVGHLLQYHPAFIRLTELVASGAIGDLLYVYSNRLNLGRFRQEEDILWSFAPHDISMILTLMGSEPLEVEAIGSYHLSEHRADVTMTHLSFSRGRRAHVYVSWLHPYKEQRLVLVGDEGMAVFDDGQPWDTKLRLYPHSVAWKGGVPEPVKGAVEAVKLTRVEPLRAECEHFLACVSGRGRPRTDGSEGLRVLRVLDRAARSMNEGRREK